jgi:sulfoxide reductase heme-binding subunit YedZ
MHVIARASAAQRHRLRWRLVWHHAVLAIVSVVLCTATFAALPDSDAIWRLSMATAYVALALLAVTLLIGPLKVLRDRHGTLSDDLRRDTGIWAAIFGIVHVIVGIQIHMGSPWLYFFYGAEPRPRLWPFPVRVDVFGVANYAGLAATLVLVLLLLLSNDLSLRSLGSRWWKRLQQLSYVALGGVALHSILYQRLEERQLRWVVLFWVILLAAVTLQLVGFRIRRARILARTGLAGPAAQVPHASTE